MCPIQKMIRGINMATPKQHVEGWKAQTEYCAEYEHNGQKWAMNFFAIDDADALEKLESIKTSLVILGRLDGRVKVLAGG